MSSDAQEQKKQAGITALRMLAATPKSRKVLERKLFDKGYPEEAVRDALDQLEKQGLLSDRAYAQNMTSRFLNDRPSGKRKIEFELKRRGISKALQSEILNGISEQDENERAREIGERTWEKFSKLPIEKRRKKVYDFLIRRGFNFQTAKELIDQWSRSESTES